MEIRRLVPADAAAYRELRLRALREHADAFTSSYEDDSRKTVEDSAKRLASPDSAFWGAWKDRVLVGMVGLEFETRAKNRHKATVVGMYVAPEHAGTGTGRRLCEVLIEEARHKGLELLVLTVTDGNGPAATLYEHVGFRSFGIEPKAIKVGGRFFGKNHMALDLAENQS